MNLIPSQGLTNILYSGSLTMIFEFKILDLGLEIRIIGGSASFFDMFLLMENILHYLRTKNWLKEASQ